jgi:hypothetical protein
MTRCALSSLLTALAVSGLASAADPVTFTKDVAPVLAQRCVRCHQPGSVAPMSLLTYEETRPWAKAIRQAIADRLMPPWRPDPAHGKWQNDMSLTQAERDTLVAWVDQGAKRGEGVDAPLVTGPAPEWELGAPDYVIELPSMKLPASGDDIFPTYVVELKMDADHWIGAVEFAPGDRKVVHHIISFIGDAQMGTSQYDVRTTTRSGGAGAEQFGVWVAGAQPTVYPEGMGRTLSKSEVMTFQMHYHLSGDETTDATRVGLHYGKGEMQKKVTTNFGVNLGIVIPPGDPNYTETAFHLFDQDSRIISFMPHAHVRCKSAKYTAHYPDGRSEILLNVPKYDYNWQWIYRPVSDLIMPAGTRIEVELSYDNSAGNPRNPDPKATLYYREQTLEEMFVGFMESVPVEGVRPKAMPPAQKVATILAAHPTGDSYLNDGLMGLPWGLYMPKNAAAGKWYIAFGPLMFTSNLWNLTWNGDAFSFDSTMVTQGGGGQSMHVEGTQAPTGELAGQIKLGVMENQADPNKKVMSLPFKGKRPVAATTGD